MNQQQQQEYWWWCDGAEKEKSVVDGGGVRYWACGYYGKDGGGLRPGSYKQPTMK